MHLARIGERILLGSDEGAWALPETGWALWRERLAGRPLLALEAGGRFVEADDPLPSLSGTDLLRWASGRLSDPGAINLLQGDFAPARDQADRLRLGRWAAILAGLALVLALADAAAGVMVEQKRRDALRGQMAQVFRQVLPDARMTADPAAQLMAEFGSGRRSAGSGFFELLGRAAPALAPNAGNRLMAVEFRLGVVEIDVAGRVVAGWMRCASGWPRTDWQWNSPASTPATKASAAACAWVAADEGQLAGLVAGTGAARAPGAGGRRRVLLLLGWVFLYRPLVDARAALVQGNVRLAADGTDAADRPQPPGQPVRRTQQHGTGRASLLALVDGSLRELGLARRCAASSRPARAG